MAFSKKRSIFQQSKQQMPHGTAQSNAIRTANLAWE
jgi:hypothetical protein